MGVSALAAGAIRCALSTYPQATVFFLDYGRKSTVRTLQVEGKRASVRLVNLRFSKRLYLPNNIALLIMIAALLRIIPSRRMRDWLAARNRCLREICRADVLASVAGGDSFSDIYGLGRFVYISLPQILVILLGKRLILLPQTYGPFNGKISRALAKYIVGCAERVYARDYRGLRELSGRGTPSTNAAFCYDMAFGLEPTPPPEVNVAGLSIGSERKSGLVGLNVSGLLFMAAYTHNNAFSLRSDYQGLVHDLIDFLISKKGAEVLLIPHVFGNEAGSESDVPACERVFSDLGERYSGRLGVVRGSYDQSEIKYVIGLCDFFIGSRMHACIAAVSQHIPAVSVAYSDKFLGVMETIGICSLTADARKLGRDEILKAVDQAYENRRMIAAELEARMPQVKASVLNLFHDVQLLPGRAAINAQPEALPGSAS